MVLARHVLLVAVVAAVDPAGLFALEPALGAGRIDDFLGLAVSFLLNSGRDRTISRPSSRSSPGLFGSRRV
ncbi:MAG: hypothetical protein M0C28_26870 [Candidatus Moduliflexus flocculans]|nr:hypothetical protein [Candidatus Moduliflexus flocculans]